MKRLLDLFLAYFRLNLRAVCRASKGKGYHDDFHDYPDSTFSYPAHFYLHKCRRCGKRFYI